MKPSSIKWIAIVVLLGLSCGALYYFFGQGEQDLGGSEIGVVTRDDLLQRVTIAGTIVPKRRTVVSGPYDGYVKQLYVKIGQNVKAGEPLVSVAQSLQSSEAVFPLRAPYAGTVVFIQKYEGEAVKSNDPADFLLRVDDLSELFVQASAPEVDRAKLKLGQEALIRASAVPDYAYNGVIQDLALAPREDSSNMFGGSQAEYPVRIAITNKDKKLGPGMSAVIDIVTSRRDKVLTLRHEYVLREKDGYAVTLENGTKRPVKVGMQNEEAFEILSGVDEGTRVRLVDFNSLPESI
ncbi:MAG: HlyD family efflux transporter periplasmic adaptor subunit [Proteobacteria bacterium]|nr:MAG: HlyD family efflux transporter periplasmic adaptor subunit [Pseudomonadota bacterium]